MRTLSRPSKDVEDDYEAVHNAAGAIRQPLWLSIPIMMRPEIACT